MSVGSLARVLPLFSELDSRRERGGGAGGAVAADELAGMSVRLDGWVSRDGDEDIRHVTSIFLSPGQQWSTLDERVAVELGLVPVDGVVELDAVVFQFDGAPIRLRRLRARVTPRSPGGGLRLGSSVARLRLSFGASSAE